MSQSNHPLRVIDLFAGAGGFGLGFYLAGYRLLLSVEKDKWACETLVHNQHSDKIENADIRTFDSKEQVEQISMERPDIVIGGPPCQGFSVAGPADKKDPNDPRNTLFEDFARWISYLQPKIFVMENVKGIVTRKNSQNHKVIDIIVSTFEYLGYNVDTWILNAALYGVPQIRERVFLVGHKQSNSIPVPPITHYLNKTNGYTPLIADLNLCPAISAGDAISDLPDLKAGEGEEGQVYTKESQNSFQAWARTDSLSVYNHVAMNHTERIIERFRRIQAGDVLSEVPEEYRVRRRNGNGSLSEAEYHSNYRHLEFDKPSFTIPASFYSSFIHPTQPRNITAREAARIQSFPDWYQFMGKRTVISSKLLQKKGRLDEDHLSQYNQIGNAVPPLLAKAIAVHLRQYLEV